MKLTLGFIPCPNDTFIFDALVNKKIDTEGLEFDVVLEDVETLNKWSFEEKLDIQNSAILLFFKISINMFYLNSGAALGKGVGPLLISKHNIQHSTFNFQQSKLLCLERIQLLIFYFLLHTRKQRIKKS